MYFLFLDLKTFAFLHFPFSDFVDEQLQAADLGTSKGSNQHLLLYIFIFFLGGEGGVIVVVVLVS